MAEKAFGPSQYVFRLGLISLINFACGYVAFLGGIDPAAPHGVTTVLASSSSPELKDVKADTDAPSTTTEDDINIDITAALASYSSPQLKALYAKADTDAPSTTTDFFDFDDQPVIDAPLDLEDGEQDHLHMSANLVRRDFILRLVSPFAQWLATQTRFKLDGDRWLCKKCVEHAYEPERATKDWGTLSDLRHHERVNANKFRLFQLTEHASID